MQATIQTSTQQHTVNTSFHPVAKSADPLSVPRKKAENGVQAVANVGAGAGCRLASKARKAGEHGVNVGGSGLREQLQVAKHEEAGWQEAMRAEPIDLKSFAQD
jgi:hypothetical protein